MPFHGTTEYLPKVKSTEFKMLKRQMYGQANFDLLRRILQPNWHHRPLPLHFS
jgi:hypothetical protein